MTVTAPSPRFAAYAGDGGTGPFPIPFRFFASAEVKAAVVDADGGRETLEGLVIEGAGEPTGGQATTPRPIQVGETLVLWTEIAPVQPADYIAADAFPAETHEAALDRLTLIAQDHARDLARALKVDLGETPPALGTRDELVADVAAQVGAEALAQIEAAGSRELATTVATIGATKASAVAQINQVASDQADVLGFAGGGLFDTIPQSAGFDGGFAVTDMNGWTIRSTDPDINKYWFVDGMAGPVVRMKVPGVDWSGEIDAYQIAILPSIPDSFAVYLNAYDALSNGAVLPNRLAVDAANIDENILLYDTGYIPNRGAGTAVVHGTDGEWVLWEAASTGDTYHWWFSDLPPAASYGIRWEIKSSIGSGAQNIRYGASATLQSLTITETPQTVEFDFTASGSGSSYNNFGVRGDGTNTPKLLVRRIILKNGVLAAALPVWASLKRGTGDARKELAWPNSLPKSGNFLDNTGNLARVAIRDPDHTTGNDYRNIGNSGVTLIVACKLDTGATVSSAIGVDVNAVKGTTATSLGIGTTTTSIVAHQPSTIGVGSSGWLRAAIEDEGIHILCMRAENLRQIASLAEIDFNWDTDAFAMEANVWRLGGVSSSATWKGKIRAAAIAFDFVSEDDRNAAIEKMAYDIALEGDTVRDFDFAMIYGDSRLATAISATTRLIEQVTVDGHYGTDPNLYTYQFATGGENLATLQSGDLSRMLTMAAQMAKSGRRGIVTGLLGTNDSAAMIADPTAYEALQRSTIWTPMNAVEGSVNLYFAPFNETARHN